MLPLQINPVPLARGTCHGDRYTRQPVVKDVTRDVFKSSRSTTLGFDRLDGCLQGDKISYDSDVRVRTSHALSLADFSLTV